MTGVALASLPTSSSICMIFFILACDVSLVQSLAKLWRALRVAPFAFCVRQPANCPFPQNGGLPFVLSKLRRSPPRSFSVFQTCQRDAFVPNIQTSRTQLDTHDRKLHVSWNRGIGQLTRDVFDLLLTFGGIVSAGCAVWIVVAGLL